MRSDPTVGRLRRCCGDNGPVSSSSSSGADDRFTRLRRRGLLTQEEMATLLGVCTQTVKQ
jgi:DNA-binding XRE family transcriptional regulator